MNSSSEVKPKALPIDEAGKYLGVGKTTLYGLAKTKQLRLLKVGRRTVVLIADLDAFLESVAKKAA